MALINFRTILNKIEFGFPANKLIGNTARANTPWPFFMFTRRFIAVIAVLLSAFHCVMLIFYVVCHTDKPWTIYDSALGNMSKRYCGAFFDQNWHLFSPVPATQEFRFLVRYKNKDNLWSEWNWKQGEVLEEHHRYRISTHGKLLYIFGDLNRNLIAQYQALLLSMQQSDEIVQIGDIEDLGHQILEGQIGKRAIRFAVDSYSGDENDLKALEIMVRVVEPIDYTDYENGDYEYREVRDFTFPTVSIE